MLVTGSSLLFCAGNSIYLGVSLAHAGLLPYLGVGLSSIRTSGAAQSLYNIPCMPMSLSEAANKKYQCLSHQCLSTKTYKISCVKKATV